MQAMTEMPRLKSSKEERFHAVKAPGHLQYSVIAAFISSCPSREKPSPSTSSLHQIVQATLQPSALGSFKTDTFITLGAAYLGKYHLAAWPFVARCSRGYMIHGL
jgi:hypothetical protein